MKPAMIALVWLFVFIQTFFHQVCRRDDPPPTRGWGEPSQQTEDLKTRSWEAAKEITSSGLLWVSRKEETADDLAVASVKRVILTSEHTSALIHAAINLCAIDDITSLQQLLDETEFLDRLHDLFSMFCDSDDIDRRQRQPMRKAAGQAFASAILHLLLSVGTLMNLAHSKHQRAIEGFSQGRQSMPEDLRDTVYLLARQLQDYAHSVDTGHINYLRYFGIFIVPLIYYPSPDFWGSGLLTAHLFPSGCAVSYQRFFALTCAIKMAMLYEENVSERREEMSYELLPQLFDLMKISYKGRNTPKNVPFAPEVVQACLKSKGRGNEESYATYEIRLDALRHVCELEGLGLSGVLDSIGDIWQDIELDMRRLYIYRGDRDWLLRYKNEYIGILLHKLEGSLERFELQILANSLAEALRYIREEISAEEPGHPENEATLKIFGLVRNSLRKQSYQSRIRGFECEYNTFEAWINMGSCAKSPGRMNRDPECWCSYIEDRFSMSGAKQIV